MSLNILFLTITITKREKSLKKALHNENVRKIYEENRSKVEGYFRQY